MPSSTPLPGSEMIPESASLEIRRLSHDMSNALEIIVQTSYLLSMAELKEPAAEWLRMLDTGVAKATTINQSLRSYIKQHTPS
jgi:light-regulated signal transduction histidine kinase (bacteriophytochrome)